MADNGPPQQAVRRHQSSQQTDVAVVVQTILRPTLLRSVRSVFAQDFPGRIQVLIGVDIGDRTQPFLDILHRECPPHVLLTVIDPGYSTSRRHGGLHSNFYGGALRTVLSYLANSRYVAYLDDNDWYARDHLASLRRTIDGQDWAFSNRWLVDPETAWPICRDEWDSLGPGLGINAKDFGGFVQPSTLMIDKVACQGILPLWSQAGFPDGSGEDRLIFAALTGRLGGGSGRGLRGAGSGRHSCFCMLNDESIHHRHHTGEFEARGIFWVEDRAQIARIRDEMAMARHRQENGELDAAAAACHRALALNPHAAEALHRLATIQAAGGNLAAALAHAVNAVQVDDSDSEFLATEARIRRRMEVAGLAG